MAKTENIVILDRSGSMGQAVKRFYNRVLPALYGRLGEDNEPITVITFDSHTEVFRDTPVQMISRSICCRGSTHMRPAITQLQSILTKNTDTDRNIRILTLSDGELHDQDEAVEAVSRLVSQLDPQCSISSQAVRLFTSGAQPDTRGLASILRLNTQTQVNLLDVSIRQDDDTIITQLVSLFDNDNLGAGCYLTADQPSFKSNPWSASTDRFRLAPGSNLLWTNSLPEVLIIDGITVPVTHIEAKAADIELVLKPKLEFYLNKLRVLKVVNTLESKAEIERTIKYTTELSQWIEANSEDATELLCNQSLRGRMAYFKQVLAKRRRSLFQMMQQVANDERVDRLNAAQQADYLRTTDASKNARALSRRTMDADTDFDTMVRTEVRAMHAHLSELAEIDDSTHAVSFYSQETTLGGIRAVCELVDENMLEELAATDILQLINIVGTAVKAPIGDYPDGISWRVERIYPGCDISMADITVAHMQSRGKTLYVPGFNDSEDHMITAVIPTFEDQRICAFLRKYAPNTLELAASIGMRRMLAVVSMTHSYTVCAGILATTHVPSSTIAAETLIKMVRNLQTSVGKYFDHVFEHLVEPADGSMTFIMDYGITAMIAPLCRMIQEGSALIPGVLRSIYSYEAYQTIRRLFKFNPELDLTVLLNRLLGINLDCVEPLTPLFEPNPEQTVIRDYAIDEATLSDLKSGFAYAFNVAKIYKLLSAVYAADPVATIQAVKDEHVFAETLGISYDLNQFVFYTVTQSLLKPNHKSRVDDDKHCMLIVDLADPTMIEKQIRDYVEKQYTDNYKARVDAKTTEEAAQMRVMLLGKLAVAGIPEFKQLMREGFGHNGSVVKIIGPGSLGGPELLKQVADVACPFEHRIEKFLLLIKAADTDGVVWNNGNTLRIKISSYEELFTSHGATELFEELRSTLRTRPTHVYRDKANRQGHSNGKPSYWALGYDSIDAMKEAVGAKEWAEYRQVHTNCCGLKSMKI
ncbi:Hypothetical protein MVR_LOCUS69 [uncultured virus]|nr:Hypothetical protein MVR_LOCUS69 [uncultured virus]